MDRRLVPEEQVADSGPPRLLPKHTGLYLIKQTRMVLAACRDPEQLAKEQRKLVDDGKRSSSAEQTMACNQEIRARA